MGLVDEGEGIGHWRLVGGSGGVASGRALQER